MKAFILVLFFALIAAENRLNLAPKGSETVQDMMERMKYIVALTPEYRADEVSGRFTVSIIMEKPPENVKGIDVALWGIGSNGRLVQPPNFVMVIDNDKVVLKVGYTASELTEKYGCTGGNDKVCKMELDLISTAQEMALKIIKFQMTVKLSGNVIEINNLQ